MKLVEIRTNAITTRKTKQEYFIDWKLLPQKQYNTAVLTLATGTVVRECLVSFCTDVRALHGEHESLDGVKLSHSAEDFIDSILGSNTIESKESSEEEEVDPAERYVVMTDACFALKDVIYYGEPLKIFFFLSLYLNSTVFSQCQKMQPYLLHRIAKKCRSVVTSAGPTAQPSQNILIFSGHKDWNNTSRLQRSLEEYSKQFLTVDPDFYTTTAIKIFVLFWAFWIGLQQPRKGSKA
jgi:hypothetical protein